MTPTIYQAVWGEIPEALKAGPVNVEAFAEARGWGYEMVQGPAIDPAGDAIRREWDKFKFLTLSTIPGAIMVDLDCILKDGFEYIEDGRPHCGFFPDDDPPRRECAPQPDSFVCYGPCEWWQTQLELAVGKMHVSCWSRKLLRDNKDIVQIPRTQYVHTMFTAGRKS